MSDTEHPWEETAARAAAGTAGGTTGETAAPAADPTAGEPAQPDDDPAGPAPLGLPRTPTGHADVDAHLERLGDADHLATDGHVEVYEDVHRGLRDALTALDARPGPPVPSPPYGPRS
ncbi:hypothetical protein [Streptomyces galbus]|uniref:hypothetical protein n=1 Tax=Streptomyces galbus TaxID=33898 RepID=UPI0019CCA189|nr:hypothetical protein [Streptomyces galbus]GHD36172.1 hypothetical protein GCM10010335_31930 [Streptomyces galbus]